MNKFIYFILFLTIGSIQVYCQEEAEGDTLTKEVTIDVSEEKQEGDYWCVYAGLTSTGIMTMQCDACENYINDYIVDLNSNPYPQFVITDNDFDDIMETYKDEDDWENWIGPCSDTYCFDPFGVLNSDLDDFMKDNGYSDPGTEHFTVCILQDPDEIVTQHYLLINKDEDGTGHCVALMGFQYYNHDWFHPKSKIFIWDPADQGEKKEITYTELMNYDLIYEEE